MKTFAEQLTEWYEETKEFNGESDTTRLAFLGSDVFDFTTYDSEIDELLARIMLEVLQSILDRKTFEYQAISKEHYVNYLVMCNLPFLSNKIEWGTSIRGAWLNEVGTYTIGQIDIKDDQLKSFVSELLAWSKQ